MANAKIPRSQCVATCLVLVSLAGCHSLARTPEQVRELAEYQATYCVNTSPEVTLNELFEKSSECFTTSSTTTGYQMIQTTVLFTVSTQDNGITVTRHAPMEKSLILQMDVLATDQCASEVRVYQRWPEKSLPRMVQSVRTWLTEGEEDRCIAGK